MSALALPDYNYGQYSSPGTSSEAKSLTDKIVRISDHLSKNARIGSKYAILEGVYREANIEDWDGHGAMAADRKSYILAKEFLNQLPNNISTPEITVDPDGEISFEWFISNKKLIILSIGEKGNINYVGVIGKNCQKGEEYYNQQIPQTIMELFKRILL